MKRLCDWSPSAVKRLHIQTHTPTHICTNQEQPTNQPHLKFLVIVLTWAGLMDSPATVLDLPGVAIPGKILATQAVSVQSLSLTVFLYPRGRAEAPGLVQESRVRSNGCHIAVDVRPHFILSVPSETETVGMRHTTAR